MSEVVFHSGHLLYKVCASVTLANIASTQPQRHTIKKDQRNNEINTHTQRVDVKQRDTDKGEGTCSDAHGNQSVITTSVMLKPQRGVASGLPLHV